MSTLVNCPKCRVEIESDSYYCDQCGVELYICPQCHVFGKGKRCTQCGQPLVSAKATAGDSSSKDRSVAPIPAGQPASGGAANFAPSSANQVVSPVCPSTSSVNSSASPVSPVSSEPEKTMRPGVSAVPLPVRLVCSAAGIRLGLGNGVVIGRRKGGLCICICFSGICFRYPCPLTEECIRTMGNSGSGFYQWHVCKR